MFVGTLPKVPSHILPVQESFGAGEGQDRVIGELRPGAEQFHGCIVFRPVGPSLVGAARDVADSRTHQVVFHACCLLFLPKSWVNEQITKGWTSTAHTGSR